jgi:hypothetical protein
MLHSHGPAAETELRPPVRNRYFYGKLLDVYHFELEQSYFNHKRWLLNRTVAGYGVVCGLGVEWSEDGQHVVVLPGVAIDKCGREIIVEKPSAPVKIEARERQPGQPRHEECDDDDEWVHVSLCYHECQSDPERAWGGDCDTESLCAPGSIRERYRIDVLPGRRRHRHPECEIPDVIVHGRIDYGALARFVSRPCRRPPDDCCLVLANVRVLEASKANGNDGIDITVRPIAYTNDLLFELILACCGHEEHETHGGKA